MPDHQITVNLPPYVTPPYAWRERIHAAVLAALAANGVTYSGDDRFALDVQLYMTTGMIGFHDIDNRLKDVFDALQGRVGGTKAARTKKGRLQALIPNDHQIRQATVRKSTAPVGSSGGGRLTITRLGDAGAT